MNLQRLYKMLFLPMLLIECQFVLGQLSGNIDLNSGSNLNLQSGSTSTLGTESGSVLQSGSNTTLESGSLVNSGSLSTSFCIWDIYDFASECIDEVDLVDGYEFFIHEETGKLMYGDPENSCSAQELACVEFCSGTYAPENVLSANAVVYTNENDLDEDLEENFEVDAIENPNESGQVGKWNVKSTYRYKTDITSINNDVDRVYEAGIMKDFEFFDWNDEDANEGTNWHKLNTSNFFSLNGNPLEEMNVLDVYSVSKEGYNNRLCYLAAYNTEYESVLFESFEYKYSGSGRCDGGAHWYCFEEMGIDPTDNPLITDEYHSGKQSVQLGFASASSSSTESGGFVKTTYTYEAELPLFYDKNITSQMKQDGLSIKIWVKSSGSWPSISIEENSGSTVFTTAEFEEIARAGEWKLFEAKITDWNIYSGSVKSGSGGLGSGGIMTGTAATEFGATIVFSLSGTILGGAPTASVYVDDIRMQPLNAKMSTYVYDPSTFKLVTQFDDQHFGLFYQYNKEGKLIRMLKETEKGVKTIKETQYNTVSTSRD